MEYGSYSPVFSQVKTTGAGELEPEVTAISEDSAGRLSLLLTLLIAREVVGCNVESSEAHSGSVIPRHN